MSSAFFSAAALAIARAFFLDSITFHLSLKYGRYLYLIILYMPVPHVVHFPFIACRLFFIVTFWVSFISFLALHFTQYPISAISITSFELMKLVR